MIKKMSDITNANIIVSKESELPAEALFGEMAYIIETNEIKIFDNEWKTI